MLNCRRLRAAVIASAVLLVAGVGLSALGRLPMLSVPCCYLGLFSVLGAASVLGLTFLVSLLPAEAKRLSECQH